MREALHRHRIGLQALLATALAAVLGTIGPFGTFADLGAGDRYLYWLAIVAVNWLQIAVPIGLGERFSHGRPWLLSLIVIGTALVASVPATFEVAWLESVFRPYSPSLPWIRLYLYVAILSLAVALAVGSWLHQASLAAAAERAVEVSTGPPAFLKRIPMRLGQELWCLEMEDHYLRVHTALGSDLILLRLSDAEGELQGLDGLRVHRSWWVARMAVENVERSGRRVSLTLRNGLRVPISRSYLSVVRQAGWLDG